MHSAKRHFIRARRKQAARLPLGSPGRSRQCPGLLCRPRQSPAPAGEPGGRKRQLRESYARRDTPPPSCYGSQPRPTLARSPARCIRRQRHVGPPGGQGLPTDATRAAVSGRLQNLPINLLRRGQPASLMVLDGDRQGFGDGGHGGWRFRIADLGLRICGPLAHRRPPLGAQRRGDFVEHPGPVAG